MFSLDEIKRRNNSVQGTYRESYTPLSDDAHNELAELITQTQEDYKVHRDRIRYNKEINELYTIYF